MLLALQKIAALTLAASLSAPALAADAAELGTAGTAAYERGATSGVTPQTLGEMALCAAYWTQWYGAIDEFAVSDELLIALPEKVDSDEAYRAGEVWIDLAARAYQEAESSIDRLLRDVEPHEERASQRIVDGVAGDVKAFESLMETLGTCAID